MLQFLLIIILLLLLIIKKKNSTVLLKGSIKLLYYIVGEMRKKEFCLNTVNTPMIPNIRSKSGGLIINHLLIMISYIYKTRCSENVYPVG